MSALEAERLEIEALLERRHDLRVLNSKLLAVGLQPVSLPSDTRAVSRKRRSSLDADLDARIIEGRVVPYYVTAPIRNATEQYRERFVRGAFSYQASRKGRAPVLLDVEHSRGSIRDIIGHDIELREENDGLYGRFSVLQGRHGDKALELVRSRVLRGMSIEFKPLESRRIGDVIERIDCQLDRVALCRDPAYQDARVLAVRGRS